jgi:hypothetical protein
MSQGVVQGALKGKILTAKDAKKSSKNAKNGCDNDVCGDPSVIFAGA